MHVASGEDWKSVPGFWSEADAAGLADLLELVPEEAASCHTGLLCGRSVCSVADRLRNHSALYLVDTFCGAKNYSECTDWETAESLCRLNVTAFGLGRATILKAETLTLGRAWVRRLTEAPALPPPFDFIFLDDDHQEGHLREEITLYWQLLRMGGILCGHDYGDEGWPAVKQIVDQWFPGREVLPGSNVWGVLKETWEIPGKEAS